MYPQPWAGKTEDTKVKQKKPWSHLALSSSSIKWELTATKCLQRDARPPTCRFSLHTPGLLKVGLQPRKQGLGLQRPEWACSPVRQFLSSLHLHHPPLLAPSPTWQTSPQSERDNRRECSASDQEPHRCMTSWLLIMEAAQLIHDPSRWTTWIVNLLQRASNSIW